MAAQTFYLKTSNVEVIALFENIKNKSKYLEEAVLHKMTCTANTTKEQLDLDYKKLRNNKMSLEMIKLVKETGENTSWDRTKKIITGKEKVEPPKITLKINKKKNKVD